MEPVMSKSTLLQLLARPSRVACPESQVSRKIHPSGESPPPCWEATHPALDSTLMSSWLRSGIFNQERKKTPYYFTQVIDNKFLMSNFIALRVCRDLTALYESLKLSGQTLF